MDADTLTSRSPHSDSIDASSGANVNLTRVEAGPKLSALVIIMAVALGISVATNLACFWQMFTSERETKLLSYDLTVHKTDDFAPLKAKVDSLETQFNERYMLETLKHKDK